MLLVAGTISCPQTCIASMAGCWPLGWTSIPPISKCCYIPTLESRLLGAKAAMILPVAESSSQLKRLHLGGQKSIWEAFLKVHTRLSVSPKLGHAANCHIPAARGTRLRLFDNSSLGPMGSLTFRWHGRKGLLGRDLSPTVGCIYIFGRCYHDVRSIGPVNTRLEKNLQYSYSRIHLSVHQCQVCKRLRSQTYDNGDLGVEIQYRGLRRTDVYVRSPGSKGRPHSHK